MTVPTRGRGKSKSVAGVLALFLGLFGAHHYYLGSAAAGLLIVLMNCFNGVGLIIGLVEGVMLLVMSREEFDAKYNARRPDAMEFVFQQRP
jgi:TM2 domain-containing membrane protein YozV